MDLEVLRRIGGSGVVCWGTKSGVSDTKKVLKGPERGLGVLRGFYVITARGWSQLEQLGHRNTSGQQCERTRGNSGKQQQ